MYELIKLNENDFYIDCPSKIGVVRVNGNEVVLIDSGNNKDSAKKALRSVEAVGFTVKAVYCTHSHADHIGGNRFLQNRVNCDIYAAGLEAAATNFTILEPALLFGGHPFSDIMHRATMAEVSVCQNLTPEVLPDGMSVIELPGHSYEMTGYLTKDGTAYIGDAVASADTIEKYGITYLWNVGEYLLSLEKLKEIKAERFIPSHGPVYNDISEIADINANAVRSLAKKTADFCESPICFDEFLKRCFDEYGLNMDPLQNILIGSTMRSYLSYNIDLGKIKYFFSDNIMYFEKVK